MVQSDPPSSDDKLQSDQLMVCSIHDSEAFAREVIATSPDCIKVLSLEGSLLSLSENGRRLLEIDDVTPLLNSCWINWWEGPEQEKAFKAVEEARAGRSGRFEAFAPPAKGKPKWWDVVVRRIHTSQASKTVEAKADVMGGHLGSSSRLLQVL